MDRNYDQAHIVLMVVCRKWEETTFAINGPVQMQNTSADGHIMAYGTTRSNVSFGKNFL